ncbi:unnamed protein product [Caenorhabditis auriculariae]|uniref:Uncharacterized protein n=1 Tax=Caenorhabditis auriculariae TaxID=2777116 RepID=A0A8S1H3I5_9PELO|nr:unnamed protein product [Caenorhabditis auriculariae]
MYAVLYLRMKKSQEVENSVVYSAKLLMFQLFPVYSINIINLLRICITLSICKGGSLATHTPFYMKVSTSLLYFALMPISYLIDREKVRVIQKIFCCPQPGPSPRGLFFLKNKAQSPGRPA